MTKICEEFVSIQGEAGPMFGKPCIFIRTSGCSLKCTKQIMGFDCDTKYHIEGKKISPWNICRMLKKYKTKNIVITGGNPDIQKDIDELVIRLINSGYKVQIETNGFDLFPQSYDKVIVVCSPKQNIPKKTWFFKKENVDKIDLFKFVFTNNGKDIIKFIKKYKIQHSKVYIMPEGQTRDEILNHALQVVNFCIKNNFNYSPREHIILWNKKRGV